jgi:hypothetical protein
MMPESNEELTSIKQSEYETNAQLIRKTFKHEPYTRYFQHQLADLGYYVEFIVRLKHTSHGHLYNETYNFLNESILDEYNQLYDKVLRLKIENEPGNKSFYYTDLCPKRLHKCAIEGSIIRNEVFQEKFLKKEIKYDRNDVGCVYVDPMLLDGTSFNFAFGKNRKQKCKKNECFITQVSMIRNRFDLLANNSTEIKLALKFMDRFVDFMSQLKQNETSFKYITFSYHASHTLEAELAKYSANDLKCIGVSFLVFWFVYLLILIFEFERFRLKNFCRKISFLLQCKKETDINTSFKSKFSSNLKTLFGESDSRTKVNLHISDIMFLVLISFLQFLITIMASLGLMSLIGFSVNQLLYSIVFVLMSNIFFNSNSLSK